MFHVLDRWSRSFRRSAGRSVDPKGAGSWFEAAARGWTADRGAPTGGFDRDGADVAVREGRAATARVPLHETCHVDVDGRGVLRTDHELRLGRLSTVRIHQRSERAS